MSLTVFANFLIDEKSRFERLKESFLSFYKGNINFWVINIRGKYKDDVKSFLVKYIDKHKIKIFFLESKNGWFYDSRKILEHIKTNYVFIWNEDHKNLQNFDKFNEIIEDIFQNKVEIFTYSLFYDGDLKSSFEVKEAIISNNIIYIDSYNKHVHKQRLKLNKNRKLLGQTFVISLISICSINLFKKLILKNDPPLKRWPKNTPFDFEKNSVDTHWLPFRFGIPKDEFFKCIDKEWDKDGKRLGQFRNSKNNVYQLLKKIFKFSIYLSIEKPKIIVREVINKFISRNLK